MWLDANVELWGQVFFHKNSFVLLICVATIWFVCYPIICLPNACATPSLTTTASATTPVRTDWCWEENRYCTLLGWGGEGEAPSQNKHEKPFSYTENIRWLTFHLNRLLFPTASSFLFLLHTHSHAHLLLRSIRHLCIIQMIWLGHHGPELCIGRVQSTLQARRTGVTLSIKDLAPPLLAT